VNSPPKNFNQEIISDPLCDPDRHHRPYLFG
jgi:hypothetical protein